MPELETREQALAYLNRYSPGETYEIQAFESGWVCRHIARKPPTRSQQVGMSTLILDRETGVLTVHSSLPTDLIAQSYTEAKRSGRPTPGRQIYPHQWRIDLTQTRQDDTTIEYQMTVASLTDPPEPTQQHPLVLEKDSYLYDPRDSTSARAAAHVYWMRDNNQGNWPETATTHM